jgi:peptidoglycan/xylan/chitin deacetylase (PgdA/CDA1 family)
VPGALVLCYHAVSPAWPAALSTTPERFAAQLEHLAGRGYRGARFSDLVEGRAGSRGVAVTFDDGYASVARLARPVLDRLGWPATVFVPSDFPGPRRPLAWEGTAHWLEGPHAHELEPMGWDTLRDLQESGWEIGSHTCSHPRLTRLADDPLGDELRRSRLACEAELGACVSIAYPYGDVDERVMRAAAAAGYRTGAALGFPRGPRGALGWPRVGVYRRDDLRRFRIKSSRVVRALRDAASR